MADISRQRSALTTDAAGKGGKYSVQNLTYPMDLFGSTGKYANSWVMININVQERASKSAGATPVDLSDNEKARRLPYGAEDLSAATGTGTAAGIALGVGLAKYLMTPRDANVNGGRPALKSLMGTAGAAGAASLPFLAIGALGKRKAKRITSAIQFPMPNQLTTNYSASWGTDNTWMLDMISRMGGTSVAAIAAGDAATLTRLADPIANFALSASSFAGSGTVSAATGLAANPKKEMIFESVDFRTFSMNYRFYPKNREEAVRLQNVIKELKYHMHPSYMSESKFTFVYPSEFDITFYAKDGKENLFVNKIATCVLTNMVVNSTPDGLWAAHTEGSPNGVDIQLQFKELSLQTKESIDIGY